jgi:quinol-cytochrome oxidoreductase complex cytochrome b subunit
MSNEPTYTASADSDALRSPQRVVFITKKTSAKVKDDGAPVVMSYPNLLLRELIAFQVLTIVLVGLSLFWDAPLEQEANPLLTPNPAKAPWYFLGLQELLHYFPPVVAGVLIPTLVVIALVVIPYSDVNVRGEPLWSGNRRRRFNILLTVLALLLVFLGIFEAWTVIVPSVLVGSLVMASYFIPDVAAEVASKREGGYEYLRSRPLSWWVMTWFISVAITLTMVGTFFRGPGWSWVWPWR